MALAVSSTPGGPPRPLRTRVHANPVEAAHGGGLHICGAGQALKNKFPGRMIKAGEDRHFKNERLLVKSMKKNPSRSWRSLLVVALGVVACDEPVDTDETVTLRKYPLACDQYEAFMPQFKFDQEVLIKKTDVVNDPCRTTWTAPFCTAESRGKWTAWQLFTQMAGGADPSPLIHALFKTYYTTGQVVNGVELTERTLAKDVIIGWRRQSANCLMPDDLTQPCLLDKNKAPFRLLAVHNREDLRTGQGGYGGPSGEGRLEFNILKFNKNIPQEAAKKSEASLIFEFRLPSLGGINAADNAKKWADRWHKLSEPALQADKEAYNKHLQTQITDVFATTANLSQVRSAEIEYGPLGGLSKSWSFREFELKCPAVQPNCGATQKQLIPRAVAQTPDSSMNKPVNKTKLESYINQPGLIANLFAGTNIVPDTFPNPNSPFRGAESLASKASNSNNRVLWGVNKDTLEMITVEGAKPFEARHIFGLNTCNGCHYDETNTNDFLFVASREPGNESILRPFLATPTTMGATHSFHILGFETENDWYFEFNEPRRRVCELIHAWKGNAVPLTQNTGTAH